MNKFIKKTGMFALLLVGLSACSDEYFDVNTPSGTAQEDQLRVSDLMAPVMYRVLAGQHSAEQAFGNYTQYFVGQGGTASGETTASGLWSSVYLYTLPNIITIKEKAEAIDAIHYSAVANIITAINLGIATDSWGSIPYSEATNGQDNLFPAFDSQEFIYQEIFNLLDGAIVELQKVDESGTYLGTDDLIYEGDIDKWIRAAYTLKARYQLHVIGKGSVTASDVLATIENGFESNADDFQMFYDDKNQNPWYSTEVVAKGSGNFHNDLASQLVSSMNGDYFPFESNALSIDPRLPVFGENDGTDEWKGYVSGGGGLAPDGTLGNTGFSNGGFYTSIDSPLLLISYAEAQFIKAEAAFLANGGSTTSTGTNSVAYNAYLEGIQASMSKYGVDATAYIADGAVAVGESGLKLQHIMKEKYIHNFLNPETFVDFRRYDFSDDVFKGLKIREEEDSDGDYVGQWFRRASYPSTEEFRNPENVAANEETPVTPVWWDE
ncbi:SusD-like protein [Formosa agariphila KMM 3901]|uniref:SusD-like protein n=1 Tax=Formosa agariphila (strain DSM 15362 / KCTC 12365 / LMG 23005 / KMM 3901 / M-2Alg 35-1) TaxID=1347342 RepID=T2KPJ4_FORAG|nr:SusD/RagB family nutrient-binding outer membrane lipoprotein [Formosa agariphila]CDF80757.1 SusD-like protein [Formosa agariphila KMM 3901]